MRGRQSTRLTVVPSGSPVVSGGRFRQQDRQAERSSPAGKPALAPRSRPGRGRPQRRSATLSASYAVSLQQAITSP